MDSADLAKVDLFRAVVEAALTAIIVVDRDSRIVLANPASLQVLGYRPEDLMGEPLETLLPARIRGEHRQLFDGFIAAPEVRPMGCGRDLTARHKDGHEVPVEIALSPFATASGTCVLAMITDITERKRAEAERAQLAAIVDSSDDAVIGKTLDGIVTSWNRGAETMLGWTAAEMVGQSIMRVIPPDRRQEETQILATLRSGQSVKHFDTIRLRRDGTAMPVSLTVSPIRDARGQVIGASKIMRDISERQHTEQARALLAAMVEASDDAIISTSLEGLITSWNNGATALFGWTEAEVVGHPLTLIFPPGKVEEGTDLLASVRAGHGIRNLDTVRMRRDGSEVPVSLTVSPIHDRHGQPIGSSRILRDITERRRSEQALREAYETLEQRVAARTKELAQQLEARRNAEAALAQAQKMEAVGQLTGGIAHDFNNLLTVISGNLHFVAELAAGNDRLRRLAASMQRAVDRGARLTGQLLAFARRQTLMPEVLRIDELIRDFNTLVQRAVGESVHLDVNSDRALWACEIDPAQFEAAVLNLAINARDAMASGGRLTISARNVQHPGDEELPAGKYVALTVADTGRGMTPEVLAHAVEPFFTTKEVGKGSGLGLSQVYGFAQQSGGALRITSRVGEGTRITLMFPRSEAALSTSAAIAAARPIVEQRPAQVLVVEDDLELLDLVIETLTASGLEVIGAHDGQEALELLGEHPEVRLMLSDVVMPNGTSGVDLGKEAQRRRPDLRVMLMSGYPRDELSRFGSTAMFPFMAKPFRPGDLVDRLDKMLHDD